MRAVAPERIWKWGHRSGAKVGAPIRRKVPLNFFWVVPLYFLALKSQLVVLLSAFVIISTVWSVSCLLFFYLRCPMCPAICKSGGTWPPCPMELAPLDARKVDETREVKRKEEGKGEERGSGKGRFASCFWGGRGGPPVCRTERHSSCHICAVQSLPLTTYQDHTLQLKLKPYYSERPYRLPLVEDRTFFSSSLDRSACIRAFWGIFSHILNCFRFPSAERSAPHLERRQSHFRWQKFAILGLTAQIFDFTTTQIHLREQHILQQNCTKYSAGLYNLCAVVVWT